MRYMVSLLFVSALYASQSLGSLDNAPGRASFVGQITNAATGESVAGVLCRLYQPATGGSPSYSASSGGDGRVQFVEVMPGEYLLDVHKVGYVDQPVGASHDSTPGRLYSLRVDSQEPVVTIRIIPSATISGTIVAGFDRTTPIVSVYALSKRFVRGQASVSIAAQTISDPLGAFSLPSLKAGVYYVCAHASRERSDGSTILEEELSNTCYPDSPDETSALAINVSSGDRVSGVDILTHFTRAHYVKGIVQSADLKISEKVVSLLPVRESGYLGLQQYGSQINEKGRFEVEHIPSGKYILRILDNKDENGVIHVLSSREIAINSDNMDNLVLLAFSPVRVSGKIARNDVEGDATISAKISLRSTAHESSSAVLFAEANALGEFVFEEVDPGTYTVNVASLPQGIYIEALSLNGRRMKEQQLEIAEGTSNQVDILLGKGAGTVEGTVEQGDMSNIKADVGQKLKSRDSPNIAFLINIDSINGQPIELIGAVDKDGLFKINNVPPGRYHAFAVDASNNNFEIWQNPEFVTDMSNRGTPLQIGKNEYRKVTVAQITNTEVEERESKLPIR
jgi:hypothetical protein